MNLKNLMNKRVSDSRRVKDARNEKTDNMITLYGVPKDGGTMIYKDKECTQEKCFQPYHKYRKSQVITLNNYNWWLEMLKPNQVSDSRRVKDNVTHKMYMCDVWVDLTEKDKNELYEDVYISKSNDKRYNSEDWLNGELDLEGEFQPTFDDAFDEAIRLCYKLAEKFPNDPYIINIDEFDVDDETGDTDNADSYASYNAWYNEHTGKIMWVG